MHKTMTRLIFFLSLFFAQNILCSQLEQYDPISGTLSSIEQVTPLSEKISEQIKEIVETGKEVAQEMIKKTPELSSQIWELVKDHPYLALTGGATTLVLIGGIRKYLKNQKLKHESEKLKKVIEKTRNINPITQITSGLDDVFDTVNKELDKTEHYLDQLRKMAQEVKNGKNSKPEDIKTLKKNVEGLLYTSSEKTKNTEDSDHDTSEEKS